MHQLYNQQNCIAAVFAIQFSFRTFSLKNKTRRYGLLCEPSSRSCGGLRPLADVFLPFAQKKYLIMLVWPILGHFWCSVTLGFISTVRNFEKNLRNPKQNKKIIKFNKR